MPTEYHMFLNWLTEIKKDIQSFPKLNTELQKLLKHKEELEVRMYAVNMHIISYKTAHSL